MGLVLKGPEWQNWDEKEHFLMQNQKEPSKKQSCPLPNGLRGEGDSCFDGIQANGGWPQPLDPEWNGEFNRVALLARVLSVTE